MDFFRLHNIRSSSMFVNSKTFFQRKFHESPLPIESNKHQKDKEKEIGETLINPEQWTVNEVVKWAKQFIKPIHALKLRKQEVNGIALLNQTKKDLQRYRIPGGPASILASEIEKLKDPHTKDPFDSLSTTESKYQHLLSFLSKVEITLPSPIVQPEKQKTLLGSFNLTSACLPFCESNIDMRLLGLSQHTPTKAASIVIEALDDLSSSTDRKHFAFVGPSGCSKTRSIFDVASKHWVMNIECTHPSHERFDTTEDLNFRMMVECISDIKKSLSDFKRLIETRIYVELVVRFLYLRGLFEVDRNILPSQYILGQINGGQRVISLLYNELAAMSWSNSIILLSKLLVDLEKNFLGGRRLLVAVDEASIAMKKIMYGDFKSPSGKDRGLLTLLSQILVKTPGFPVSTLYAGTAFTMLNAESIQSDIGKENALQLITSFPVTQVGDPEKILKSEIDMSQCDDVWNEPPRPRNYSELVGRKRLIAGVVRELTKLDKGGRSKSNLLRAAIEKTIDLHYNRLKFRLKEAIQKIPGIRRLLKQIVVADLIYNGKVIFPISEDKDLVDLGICQLISKDDKYWYQLGEPFAVRAINDIFSEIGSLPEDIL